MRALLAIFVLFCSSVSGAIHIKKESQSLQREEFLLALQKESQRAYLVLTSMPDLELLKKIVDVKQKSGTTISIITKKTKRNAEGITFLQKNQIEVMTLSPKKKGSFLSYLLLEGQKSVWLHIEPLFRKTTYSKIPIETVLIHDQAFYEEFYRNFTLEQKECSF